ncbi:WD40 repeat-like protein, partial [Hypoxylon sp. EC38]
LGPNKLWAAAYKKLRDEDPDVLRAYEKLLLEKDDDEIPLRDGDWEEQVQRLAQERLQAVQEKRFRLQIGDGNIVVRDQLQKVMGFIVSTKDFVSAAISSEPHAAIAWASVMFIFPLLNKMLQQDKDAVEGFEYILSLLVRCKLMENDFLQPTAGDPKPSSSENHHKLALSLQSKTIELYSKVYKYQVRVILHLEHSALTRYLRDIGVSDDWKGMIETLKATEREIKDDLQGLSNHTSKNIDKKFEEFRSKVDVFLELCKKTMENIKDIEQASHLGHLPVAHSAAFNASEIERERYCMPGTQMKILNDLQQWLESPTGKPILWLHGMAGTGKSTIARTVATALSKKASFANSNQLPDNISLGATFFFKQDDARRNHAGVLFTTLAHQLAHEPLGLESEIADAIKRNASPDIGVRSPKVQWDELILKPLKALEAESPSPIRLVLIIDALDECQAKETGAIRVNAQHIIQSLKQVEELSKVQIRVLITSRNESHIDRAFKNIPEKSYDEIELSKVSLDNHHDEKKDDITIYLESELLEIEINNGHSSKWPSADDIRKLVEKAGGLFIYAATTCKFLDVQPDLAKKRLHQVLKGSPNKNSPPFILSQIYSTVLDFYTRDWTEEEKQEDHDLKEILRLIVVLFKPLPICSLAKFTKSRISTPRVHECLENIRSVVDLPQDPKSTVGLVHLSFHEFLLDEKRCKKTGFLVEPTMMHIQLFERCLEIMSHHLHMDMCDLQKPGIFFVEIPPVLVQQCIPPYLQYACRYWVDHLLQLGEVQEVQDALVDHGRIHKFLREHVLSWLEALGLTGELGIAVHMISHLKALVNVSGQRNPELSKLLHDANRFILFNRHNIQEAPLQVYYSALLFSPTKSIIRSLFLNLFPKWIMKPPAVNDDWDAELMTLEGHKRPVNSIAISPDSKMIVSGSSDGTARLWEADTGIETAKIDFGPSDLVQSVAFSSDGQTVALCLSYSREILLYDVATGEISSLLSHSHEIVQVAFCPCPDSKILGWIADDQMLYLWDMSTKQQIYMHEIREEQPTTIAFSPDGNLVAAGSGKYGGGAVSIWGVETGELMAEFNYSGHVRSIAFSPDGVTMASITWEGLLEI